MRLFKVIPAMAYDGMNRLVSVSDPVDAATTVLTSYGYDLASNTTQVVDGDANVTTYSYNSWNLRETIVEPATAGYPTLTDRSYVTSYDAGGLPVDDAMPGGVDVVRVFDELGRLTTISGTGDGAASNTYSYDWVSPRIVETSTMRRCDVRDSKKVRPGVS